MSVSCLDIYNMALGFIGTRMLASEREATPEAVQCALYFDRARRAAIRDYPYPFCRKKIRLGRVEMPEEYADDWKYAYAMPRDALKIIRINDYEEFEIARMGQGLAIFCDSEHPLALCAVDVPDPADWDELFTLACAYRLAMCIAIPLLKNNPAKIQELSQLYASLVPAMQGHGASEGRSPKVDIEDWISARENW